MKTFTYILLFVVIQISYFTFAVPLITQYKCLLWDSPCLTAKAQEAVPILTNGIPELGVEKLDTMFIDSLHIDQDGYKADWYNIYLQGLKNTIIDKISIDMTSKTMRLLFHTDLSLKARYIKEGYLLSLPISGDGEVTMKLKNVHMEFVIPFEIVKDDYGRDIMDLKGYQYWYDVKNGFDVNFGNLYYGNNELSRRMHALIQLNWKPLTIKYGRYLFDKSNDKIFNAIRNYMRSQPLNVVANYY